MNNRPVFKTIEDISLAELTHTFNSAFSDYLIKLQFTEEQMLQKLKDENIQLSLSFGAFDKGKLIAFILHATDSYYHPDLIYNAGTGVVPQHRGRRIVEQLYTKLLFGIPSKKDQKQVLEVAVSNEKAIKIYSKIGFKIQRNLVCYKGRPTSFQAQGFEIKASNSFSVPAVFEFCDSTFSWQNNFAAMARNLDQLTVHLAYKKEEIIGYCIFNKTSGRLHQLAVNKSHRNQGVGKSLLGSVIDSIETSEISIINVDTDDNSTGTFLRNSGLTPFFLPI